MNKDQSMNNQLLHWNNSNYNTIEDNHIVDELYYKYNLYHKLHYHHLIYHHYNENEEETRKVDYTSLNKQDHIYQVDIDKIEEWD